MDDVNGQWAATPAKSAFERRVEAGEWDAAFAVGDAGVDYGESARAMFGFVVEAARASFDPSTRWDEFVEEVWVGVDNVFQVTGPTEEQAASIDALRRWQERSR